jgi:hypothetical protein
MALVKLFAYKIDISRTFLSSKLRINTGLLLLKHQLVITVNNMFITQEKLRISWVDVVTLRCLIAGCHLPTQHARSPIDKVTEFSLTWTLCAICFLCALRYSFRLLYAAIYPYILCFQNSFRRYGNLVHNESDSGLDDRGSVTIKCKIFLFRHIL